MVFPSITVCNLNQVEASFIKEPIDFENVSLSRMTKTDLLMKEFMFGHQDDLTQEEEKYLDRVKNWRNFKAFTFLEWTRQYCNHAFISSNFRGLNFTWRDLKKEEIYYKISYGPRFHPTDFGACCRQSHYGKVPRWGVSSRARDNWKYVLAYKRIKYIFLKFFKKKKPSFYATF